MKFVIECDSQDEFETYLNGPKYYSALWTFAEEILRAKLANGEIDSNYQTIMKEFFATLDDCGVDLER